MNIENGIFSEATGLRWLFVDMNGYFASCEQQDNPALRGKPVIVAPVMTDSTSAIAASYEAKAFGIKTGTKIWEAKKLCPDIKIVPARHKLYTEYHHKFVAAIEACIPIEAVRSIDEVACRLDKVQCQPEKARALALAIKQSIRDHAGEFLKCSIGIASSSLLAKLASDMQKPDGLVVLEPADLPQAILHLKPQAISGIGYNMVERLRRNGIHTMADLWAIDAQRLRRIWNGIGGLRFHTELHGVDLQRPESSRHSISHQHVLAPKERNKETCALIMRQHVVRLGQRLRDEGFYASRMYIQVKWANHQGYYVDEASFKQTQDTSYLLPILTNLWRKIPNLQPLRIGVVMAGLTSQTNHQPDLFDQPKPASLTKAIDALNGKFGRGTIHYGASLPAMTSKIAFNRIPGLKEF